MVRHCVDPYSTPHLVSSVCRGDTSCLWVLLAWSSAMAAWTSVLSLTWPSEMAAWSSALGVNLGVDLVVDSVDLDVDLGLDLAVDLNVDLGVDLGVYIGLALLIVESSGTS